MGTIFRNANSTEVIQITFSVNRVYGMVWPRY